MGISIGIVLPIPMKSNETLEWGATTLSDWVPVLDSRGSVWGSEFQCEIIKKKRLSIP